MTTATAMLNICRSQIGYLEGPKNANKYGAWYGENNAPYCAIGLMWAAAQAGAPRLFGARFAYCPTWVTVAQRRGVWASWQTTPRPGDIVFFDWSGRHRLAMHVGIVESFSGNTPVTIEFNTTRGTGGNQGDGGGVWRRRRNPAMVVGYARPPYTPQTPPQPLPHAKSVPLTVDGVWGPKTTAALQRWLNIPPMNGTLTAATRVALQRRLKIPADGDWGPQTHKVLQVFLHVTPDGQWGPITIKALQAFLNRTE